MGLMEERSFKEMINFLEDSLGVHNAGLFVAFLCDALNHYMENNIDITIDTLELVFNNGVYSLIYDLANDEYVETKGN